MALRKKEARRWLLKRSMLPGYEFDDKKKRVLMRARALLQKQWRIYRVLRARYKQYGW